MGAWGVEPWESDGAADWFGATLGNTGIASRIAEAITGPEDDYDAIRAASYLLLSLGRPMIWPGDPAELPALIQAAIQLQERMVDPQDAEMDFIELWEDEPEVIDAVKRHVQALRALAA